MYSGKILINIVSLYWVNYALIALISSGAFLLNMLGMILVTKFIGGDFSAINKITDFDINSLSQDHLMILFLFVVILSSFMIFFAKSITVRIMMDYERMCANKIFEVFN